MPSALFLLCQFALAAMLTLGFLGYTSRERRHAAGRLRQLTRGARVGGAASLRSRHTMLLSAASATRRLLALIRVGKEAEDPIRARLEGGGIRRADAVDLYLGIRLLAPISGLLAGLCIPFHRSFLCLALGAAFYLLPDMYLRRRISRYQGQVSRSLPEALDLLVICVEAGLGIDQALLRVSQEVRHRHRALAEEFFQVNLEQRAGKPRVQAWRALADRMDIAELTSFVGMLSQADRFGTPIARALSEFAANLRERRRQSAEERAVKTTVKIIFPLVLFIFPSIFIVLLGPAVLTMLRTLGSMNK